MSDQRVEAALYMLFRRIAPTIRHEVAGALNPLGMLCDALHRRLINQPLDPATIVAHAEKIKRLSDRTIQTCTQLMTWMAPPPETHCGLLEGVTACVEILRPEFNLRGCSIEHTALPDCAVSSSALRTVLTVALIALVDAAEGPVHVRLDNATRHSTIVLSLEARATRRTETIGAPPSYRKATWEDVGVLAVSESVRFAAADNRVTLEFLVEQKIPELKR